MNLSQIYISDEDKFLPQYLQNCQTVTKSLIPHSKYVLYDKDSLRSFIDQHFDDEVVSAFDKLKPYSYKSDLGRFCLLYQLGGWYVDIALKPLHQVSIPDDIDFLVFRELYRLVDTSWGVYTGVIFSKPQNPIFLIAIKLIIDNCNTNYYGINALSPTGPNLLGRAIAIHDSLPNTVYGDVVLLTQGYLNPNKAMVFPNGDIFGFFKQSSGGDLTKLGAKGVNNYNEFYNSRNVYEG